MKVPVLIPARNEAVSIGRNLDALANQRLEVEPIVIVNGCTDNTAEIALAKGATVLEAEEGKTVALQRGLRYLGERSLEPVLTIDADSVPMSPNWSSRMIEPIRAFPEPVPVVAWGPSRFINGSDGFSDIARTIRSAQIHFSDRNKIAPRSVHGANMALRIQNEEVLDALLGLDNYWQRGDVAIHDAFIAQAGIRKHVLHWQAFVETDGARFPSVWRRLRLGHEAAHLSVAETYDAEASSNSVNYTLSPLL